jgi:hypothetical protein
MIKQAAHHITLMVLSLVMANFFTFLGGTNECQIHCKEEENLLWQV